MTGGIAVGGAGAVAKGVLYTIGATKLKVAAVAAVASVAGTVVAVGAIAGASAMLQPRGQQVALPPAHAQAATTNKAQAMAELSGAYTLADSQMMRVIRPPFPAARAAWADAEFPSAQGSQNILSLGFRTTPAAGRLDWRYMSYEPLELENLVRDVPWFRIEGLERVSFPPIAADVVVRGGITDQQHLEAVADVVEQFTGARFRIVRGQTTRPCVILKGPTRRPAESRPGFATVILTQSPLNPAATKRWLGGDLVEGTRSESRLAYASKLLDAPVFLDGSDSSTSAELNDVGLYLVAPDAQLEWRDPLYEARLKRILANLPRQVGGDWRIEHRTLDVLRFEPAAGP
jgi:hypothetical protein